MHEPETEVREDIKAKVRAIAKNGKMTCAEAQMLAKTEGIPLAMVGKAVEAAGIKISDCQLGCFGKNKGK